GGQVGVVSTLGRGSTFWIELPGAVPVQKATAAPEEQPSLVTARSNQVEASMRQVLVIDDSIHMRRML
ncbi:MAG TPA: hypothetical protein DCL54_06315, partial [Alphaproteobacteria bacterium]|nr:hypothetical protein [Alphaproteobacteria bacterium]